MSESHRSLRWDWILFGWFMSVALASFILLALGAFGLLTGDPAEEMVAVAFALAIGFFVIGIFIGSRVAAAPILHGLAMSVCSVFAWFAVNLLAGSLVGEVSWWPISVASILGLFALQAIAGALGLRIGVRRVRALQAG
jgi:hypothetical protein